MLIIIILSLFLVSLWFFISSNKSRRNKDIPWQNWKYKGQGCSRKEVYSIMLFINKSRDAYDRLYSKEQETKVQENDQADFACSDFFRTYLEDNKLEHDRSYCVRKTRH
jgi:hypothetical protein